MRIGILLLLLLFSMDTLGVEERDKIYGYSEEGVFMIFMVTDVERKTVAVGHCEKNKLSIKYQAISTSTSGSITIPSEVDGYTVTSIYSEAFKNCSSVSSVKMPNSIVSIDESAFAGCTSLNNIVISSNLCQIGWYAFDGCSKLGSIELPNSTNYIARYAFKDCSSLKEVRIPEGITQLDNYTFLNCSKLSKIYLPSTLLYLSDDDPFGGCSSLSNIYASDYNSLCRLLCQYGNPCKTDNNHIFINDVEQTVVNIPSDVAEINDRAFYGFCNLKQITLPTDVTSIGSSAFGKCSSLSTLIFHEGIKTIGDDAFKGCLSLNSISIPRSISSIGNYAFYGCKSLQTIKSKIVDPYTVYSAFDSISTNVVLYVPFGQKKKYESAHGWPHSDIVEEDAVIGDTFETTFLSEAKSVLGNFTVQGLSPLSVSISEGTTTSINSLGVKELELPAVVTGSDNTPFNVIGIDSKVFSGTTITSVIIPKSIRSIEEDAFGDCKLLNSVLVSWRNPFEIEADKDNFDGLPENAVLYVPAGTKERYEALEPWSKFSQIIESSPISAGDISVSIRPSTGANTYIL